MTLDSIDRDAYINDLKTSIRKWTEQKVKNAYQPKIYKLGYRAHCPTRLLRGFQYHILVCTKKTHRLAAYKMEVNPTDAEIVAVLERFSAMHRSIQAGVFVPCPKGFWKCSAEYCEFFRDCKYG